jgi:hypothetical protein
VVRSTTIDLRAVFLGRSVLTVHLSTPWHLPYCRRSGVQRNLLRNNVQSIRRNRQSKYRVFRPRSMRGKKSLRPRPAVNQQPSRDLPGRQYRGRPSVNTLSSSFVAKLCVTGQPQELHKSMNMHSSCIIIRTSFPPRGYSCLPCCHFVMPLTRAFLTLAGRNLPIYRSPLPACHFASSLHDCWSVTS